MDCAKTLTLIERHFDGELSARQSHGVEDHLADCPECAEELESLQRMRGTLRSSFRKAAAGAHFNELWRAIAPRLEEPQPSLWERLGVAVRESFSVHRVVWASASAAAIAGVVAVPLLTRDAPTGPATRQNNECVVESIDTSGGTAMVYELDQDHTKVIWLFEDQNEDGPSSL